MHVTLCYNQQNAVLVEYNQIKNIDYVASLQQGVYASTPGRDIIFDISASKTSFLILHCEKNWIPLSIKKKTVCGEIVNYGVYGKVKNSSYDREKEVDNNFFIVPDNNSYITNALPRTEGYSCYGLFGGKWHEFKNCNQANTAVDTCIEAEITFDPDFFKNNKYFSIYEDRPKEKSMYTGQTIMQCKNICIRGPYVTESSHFNRPEIHPAELMWWKDENNKLTFIAALDASGRFDKRDNYSITDDYNSEWKPWAQGPIDLNVKIRLEFSEPTEEQNLYVDLTRFSRGTTHNTNSKQEVTFTYLGNPLLNISHSDAAILPFKYSLEVAKDPISQSLIGHLTMKTTLKNFVDNGKVENYGYMSFEVSSLSSVEYDNLVNNRTETQEEINNYQNSDTIPKIAMADYILEEMQKQYISNIFRASYEPMLDTMGIPIGDTQEVTYTTDFNLSRVQGRVVPLLRQGEESAIEASSFEEISKVDLAITGAEEVAMSNSIVTDYFKKDSLIPKSMIVYKDVDISMSPLIFNPNNDKELISGPYLYANDQIIRDQIRVRDTLDMSFVIDTINSYMVDKSSNKRYEGSEIVDLIELSFSDSDFLYNGNVSVQFKEERPYELYLSGKIETSSENIIQSEFGTTLYNYELSESAEEIYTNEILSRLPDDFSSNFFNSCNYLELENTILSLDQEVLLTYFCQCISDGTIDAEEQIVLDAYLKK